MAILLDISYGVQGVATFNLGGNARAMGLALELDPAHPNGRAVVAADTQELIGLPFDFVAIRWTSAGVPDATFGAGGAVQTNFQGPDLNGDESDDVVGAVAVALNKRLVLAGRSGWPGALWQVALARYLPNNGTLDASFGQAGTLALPGKERITSGANAVAIDHQGRIIVAGYYAPDWQQLNSQFLVARFLPDGQPDASFGTDGIVFTEFEPGAQAAYGVAVYGNDSLLAVGEAPFKGGRCFALARYASDGSLDQQFGAGGLVRTQPAGHSGGARAVVLQANNRAVVVGYAAVPGGRAFAVARYAKTGDPDPAFQGGGQLLASPGTDDIAYAVALDKKGRIVATGSSDLRWALLGSTTKGQPDQTFLPKPPLLSGGQPGTIIVPDPPALHSLNSGTGVAIDPKQRILLCGSAEGPFDGDPSTVAVARLVEKV